VVPLSGVVADAAAGAHADIADIRAADIRRALQHFYRTHRRDLPWRRSRSAYAIWISEIMLQQTQVRTVLARYTAFLQRFPSLAALAAASEISVCEAWAGLGYYRRARHLHQAARQVQQQHQGVLPRHAAALRRLPGIGRYTAGAIASIAFGEATPVVDGNVERVLSRLYALEVLPKTPAGQKIIWAKAAALVSPRQPGEFNQALMELGALVCVPQQPACSSCCLRRYCRAYQQGQVARYPLPSVARPRQALAVAFAWGQSSAEVWLVQRPLTGLWAGLWELPSAAAPQVAQAATALMQRLHMPLGQVVGSVRHSLTHRQVQATVYAVPSQGLAVQAQRDAATTRWRAWRAPLQAPLSSLARKSIVCAQKAPLLCR
jgi:A/G-specific adenine glycosylase